MKVLMETNRKLIEEIGSLTETNRKLTEELDMQRSMSRTYLDMSVREIKERGMHKQGRI